MLCGLIKDKLKVNILPSDISTAYRLGRKPAVQGQDRRGLILKLCRRDLKGDLLGASRRIRPNFYVNENLTPARNKILYALRLIRRQHGNVVRGCSSMDGNVFVYVRPAMSASPTARDIKLLVNNYTKLQEFCLEYINKPVTSFIDS